MQEHTNSIISKLLDEILNVNVNFKRPEPDAEFCKEVNNTLVKKLESVRKYLRLTVVFM